MPLLAGFCTSCDRLSHEPASSAADTPLFWRDLVFPNISLVEWPINAAEQTSLLDPCLSSKALSAP
jgi:hypothetical protein